MASRGQSGSHKSSQANVLRIFEEFRISCGSQLIPRPWDKLDEAILTDPDIYARFATYLAEEYVPTVA